MKHNFILILTLAVLCLTVSSSVLSQSPRRITLQAYLTDADNKPLTGNIVLTVRLYRGEHSTDLLYVNDISDRYVDVVDGVVNYYINNLYGIDFSSEM